MKKFYFSDIMYIFILALVEEKVMENCLRWYMNVNRELRSSQLLDRLRFVKRKERGGKYIKLNE